MAIAHSDHSGDVRDAPLESASPLGNHQHGRMGRRPLAAETAAILSAHFGQRPFTTAEARTCGVSEERLRAAVRAGAVTRDRRGVFHARPADPPAYPRSVDEAAISMAHLLAGSTLSHDSAGRFQGLPVPLNSRAMGHITLPGARTRTAGSVRIHAQKLPPSHIKILREVRVTTPARTAIDIARGAKVPEGLICMDAALRRLVTSHVDDGTPVRMAVHDDLLVAAARHGIQSVLDDMAGCPGTGNARRALGLADPASESALESQSRGVLLEYGVPAPGCGYPIEGADGRVYWVDMAWESARVVGECDGLGKYTEAAILQREKLRQEALERAGWRVVRWTYADILRAPQRLVDRIMHALHRGPR